MGAMKLSWPFVSFYAFFFQNESGDVKFELVCRPQGCDRDTETNIRRVSRFTA